MGYKAIVEAVVVGAGVVGIACARQLALSGLETILLEKEASFGQGISSRNSEVIHAGLYYEPNSWKARLCQEGRQQLYEYCESRRVDYKRTGKLVVATQKSQLPKLAELKENACRNGVEDVEWLTISQVRELEPDVSCVGALISPSTGIVDSHALMGALIRDFQTAGGVLAYRSPVIQGRVGNGMSELLLADAEQTVIKTRVLVNCAGLDAPLLAAVLEGFPLANVPARCFAKGSYYGLRGKNPFRHLIYPLPEPNGLGVHVTLDMAGQARFGPDVEWIQEPEYSVDEKKIPAFVKLIKQYWRPCSAERLTPAYAGVRPKIGTWEEPATDFIIQDKKDHGVVGLVNLFGIESPGLTSCLALACEVNSILHSK